MRKTSIRRWVQVTALAGGPLLAVLVAWALPVRDSGSGSVTLANAALAIAVVTVLVALVDAFAGLVTSVISALALNYFHTQPYHTLRITDGRDILSVVLLGLLGLGVSAATAIRVRGTVHGISRAHATTASQTLAEQLRNDQPALRVWTEAITAAENDLELVVARLEPRLPDDAALIGKHANPGSPHVVLPAGGGALRLEHRYDAGRYLVLTPRPGQAPLTVDRCAVLSFADSVERGLRLEGADQHEGASS